MLSSYDLEPCGENEKLNGVAKKFGLWWGSFWSQPDAQQKVKENYEQNEAMISSTVKEMVDQWNEDNYFAAGEAFANFWTAMIGKPALGDEGEMGELQLSTHPIADYYSAGFLDLWGEDWTNEIRECLIFDPLEISAWSFALNALNPYDEFNWMKYFYTIGTLDKFN